VLAGRQAAAEAHGDIPHLLQGRIHGRLQSFS